VQPGQIRRMRRLVRLERPVKSGQPGLA
jgi:hypothetical protein